MYKYLLWDIDGTILDFEAAQNRTIKALFEKHGLGVCTDEMVASYSKINDKYWQALERGEMSKPEILVGRFTEFFESIGVDASLGPEFNSDYQVTLGDYVVFEENAQEVLESEKGKYRLIAVTNGTKIAQTKKLKTSGLEQIFDAVYISEDVGIEKPNVGYFDKVFESEGITDKSEVLIIGDSLTSDMQGGNNAGIDTCWYNKRNVTNTKGVDITYEIHSLKDIYDIVK